MLLNFIFAHLDAFALGMWVIFFCVVLIRFLRPFWVKNISYKWLILGAVALHIFYAIFVTWGQYYVWAIGSDFTRALLASPLSTEAPLPNIFEWARAYLDGSLGYFTYYAFGRFFFKIILLFGVAGLFYAVFKLWNNYRKSLGEHGPELILILLLIAGWPGVFILIPLGLSIAALSFGVLYGTAGRRVHIEPSFLIATPLALLFARPLLDYFHILNLFLV